jgi:uncharacterized integral membrane protein (TIGR00697 family)
MRQEVYVLSRPQKLFVVCTAIFITALVIAEATSTKFFTAFTLPSPFHLFGMTFREVVMTTGVLAFPVTFIITDLMNEYFGKKGIRFVTLVGMVMIGFEFLLLQAAIAVPVASISPVSQEAFEAVFGTTGRIILGSLTAYLLGQLADITLFHWLRGLTQGRFLWLRATGSTFGSQFIDTFVVLTIAFAGQLAFQQILAITLFNYGYKLLIAIAITPLIYLAHWAMDAYLGKELAHQLTAKAAADQLKAPFSGKA